MCVGRAIVPGYAENLQIDIYARFQLTDGGYSCQLVFARTKIVPRDMSVPRAELSAATLNATTGHVMKTSFGKYYNRSMKLTESELKL